jgi:transcription antitermination factor NusG
MSACSTVAFKSEPATRWFAVKVRVRCEETIASTLREKQYEVLSPSFTEIRQYSDRVRKVQCALFSGYIFVAMDPDRMLPVLSTEGVQYVVRVGSGVQSLSESEVHTVKALCQMDTQQSQTCVPCDYLKVGQRVKIEVGPLVGLEGILVRVRDVERVVVTVESLHSSVSVEIGHTRIRVLDEPLETSNGKVPDKLYNHNSLALQTSQVSA